MITKKEVCCERMWQEIEDFRKEKNGELDDVLSNLKKYNEIPVISCVRYDAPYREYILLTGSPITYCPFCGKKLPEWLDPTDTIYKEYGEDYVRMNNDPKYKPLPPEIRKEFDTDEWWKKRGL